MSTAAQSVGRSGAVMAAGTLSSRVIGLIRAALLASVIGAAGLTADAFSSANTLPNQFYLLLAGGAIQAVLVPQIVRARHRDDGADFVNRIITVSIVFFAVTTVLLTVLAPWLVRLFFRSTDPDAIRLAAIFALICMPQVFFYGLYTVLGQVLQANNRFAAFTWAPAVANVVAVAGLVWFRQAGFDLTAPPQDWTPAMIAILGGSTTLSIVMQALVLLPALKRMGYRYRFLWGIRGYGLGEVSSVAKWTIGSIIVQQVGFFVTSNVLTHATQLGSNNDETVPGLTSLLNAFLIVTLPQGLITVSLVTALYTRMSEAAAEEDDRALVRLHAQGMRTPGLFLVPIVSVLLAFASVVSATLFYQSSLEMAGTVTTVLYGMLWMVIPMGWGYLNDRVFYAQKQTYIAFRIQCVVTSISIIGALFSVVTQPPARIAFVLALGQSVAYVVGAVIGFVVIHRQHGRLGLRSTGVMYLILAVPAAASAVGLALLQRALIPGALDPRGYRALFVGSAILGVAGLIVLVVTWAVARAFGVREVDEVLNPFRRRLALLVRR